MLLKGFIVYSGAFTQTILEPGSHAVKSGEEVWDTGETITGLILTKLKRNDAGWHCALISEEGAE